MKLVIIGNGFDLFHGLPTSFYQFRQFLLESEDDENRELVRLVDIMLKNNGPGLNGKMLWNDFESIVGQYVNRKKDLRIETHFVEDILLRFSQKFYYYLKELPQPTHLHQFIAEELMSTELLLSFNYTNTFRRYVEAQPRHIYQIHGTLNDGNLPVIGYYYDKLYPTRQVADYNGRYQGQYFHKPAVAYRQNELDIDQRTKDIGQRLKGKITKVVCLGYSFGDSDIHIYNLLNELLVNQGQEPSVPSSKIDKIQKIEFNIYDYDTEESNRMIQKISSSLVKIHRRFPQVKVFGRGYDLDEENLIQFNLVDYPKSPLLYEVTV